MRSGAEFFARLWRANFYRFTQGLHGRALLPFYAKTSQSLLPNPHPMPYAVHTVSRLQLNSIQL